MKSLNIEFVNNEVQVTLAGEIFVDEATIIREQIIPLIVDGHRTFVFNFNNVDYIDSSGLGVLVAIQKRAKQNEGDVIIKGLKGEVKELFELTRLNHVFVIKE